MFAYRPSRSSACLLTALALVSSPISLLGQEAKQSSLAEKVTEHYVQQAQVRYQTSFEKALELREAVRIFLSQTNPETHQAAKDAWLAAHRVYCATEVLRFGNPNVDAWEGKVNAWPIDEGYIDYVSEEHYHPEETNDLARLNYIGKTSFPVHDEAILSLYDKNDPKIQGIKVLDFETNVARGFHAIEFLLWGQDLNLDESGHIGGQRTHEDFLSSDPDQQRIAARRAGFLKACCELLVSDLRDIIFDWSPEKTSKSVYARAFLDLPLEERFRRIFTGLGSLSYGELAGERIQVALLAADQEDEQNCFSDTTHLVIHDNARSIATIYRGSFPQTGLTGPSIADLVKKLDPSLDEKLQAEMLQIDQLCQALHDDFFQQRGQPFDRLILETNPEGRSHLRALIEALGRQTEILEALQKRIPELIKLGASH